jgi:hypothetical protein
MHHCCLFHWSAARDAAAESRAHGCASIRFHDRRLGFIVDFLSKATLTGFMGGAAVIVSLQQLKGLLGISHFTSHMGFLDVMRSVVNRHDEVRACPCCSVLCRRPPVPAMTEQQSCLRLQ